MPKVQKTRTIVERLFRYPPVNDAELESRLSAADPDAARAFLVERLESGAVMGAQWQLLVAGLTWLGLGDQRSGLMAIAADRDRDPRRRVYALMALSHGDPHEMSRLAEAMGPVDAAAIAEASLFVLFFLEDDDAIGEAVRETLESAGDTVSMGKLAAQIEGCRLAMGRRVAETWEAWLTATDVGPTLDTVLTVLTRAPQGDSLGLFESLRDSAQTPERRRRFQKAMFEARTHAIDPDSTPSVVRGEAWIGSCDGQSGYVLLGQFENFDGSRTFTSICIRADSDVRDALFAPHLDEREVVALRKEFADAGRCRFVPLALGEAAWLVFDAVERTASLGRALPEDAEPAIRAFERLRGHAEPPPSPEPSPRMTIAAMRALLERPEYTSAWFFDAGDLREAGLTVPRHGRVSAAWYRDGVERLDREANRRRLSAMAQHMSRWYVWAGDADAAARFAWLARAAATSLIDLPLARVMLERAVAASRRARDRLAAEFGDPAFRQHLKCRFFQNVEAPDGRDLARLDFTELACSFLDSALVQLPGDRRPREAEREGVAFAIGEAFAEYAIHQVSNLDEEPASMGLDGDLEISASSALERLCDLRRPEAEAVSSAVIGGLVRFAGQMCTQCPVACIFDPDGDFGPIFHQPVHPLRLVAAALENARGMHRQMISRLIRDADNDEV